MASKKPSIQQLIEVVNAFNKAHELDLRHVTETAKQNPLMDDLYDAAAAAAKSLKPLMVVEINPRKVVKHG